MERPGERRKLGAETAGRLRDLRATNIQENGEVTTDQGLEITTLKVEVNGELGYLVGRYHLPPTDEEPADSGKYVMCLKRQGDGSWKLTADIWNSSSDSSDDADDEPRAPSSIS